MKKPSEEEVLLRKIVSSLDSIETYAGIVFPLMVFAIIFVVASMAVK